MVATAAQGSRPDRLPRLRPELQVLDNHVDGAIIYDPVRGRYFRIDKATAQLLSLWARSSTNDDLARHAEEAFGERLDATSIAALASFLSVNELVVLEGETDWRAQLERQRRMKHGWLAWAVHNYLFIRIPLLRPQKALERLAPYLAPLYSRTTLALVGSLGLIGLYLVSRQWDEFLKTFPFFFSLEGVLTYVVALALVKSLHELGHALTAVRYGCRIPSMGISFMVLVPMLYTDVTDAWRLPSSRQRLAIDAAGLVVETALACLATFAWAFLPDSPARSLAFATATTGWVLSLGLNLNPFMRFDGYYILSDIVGFPNLQPRAFAVGRWRLREWLFGLGDPPPEPFTRGQLKWLTAYAWATWIYRVILFTGIALLVYAMSFKLLGVALFLVEIIYFIALPIWREMREWSGMRHRTIFGRRGPVLAALLLALIGAAFVPWQTGIAIPAVIEDADELQIYPRRAARIVDVHVKLGDHVIPGTPLIDLVSPDLDQQISLTQRKLALAEWRFARRAGDAEERSETIVLEQTLEALRAKLAGLRKERDELHVVSDRVGLVAEIDPHLQPGRWMRVGDLLAIVRGGERQMLRGYVAEADVHRIDLAEKARFVPENLLADRRDIALVQVAAVGTAEMEIADLASHYGGAVASRLDVHGDRSSRRRPLLPVAGQFLITGRVLGGDAFPRVVRGLLHAHGRAESFAARAWRQVLKVLVRESGV
ncbi:MAG: site-2 protease family protein [Hyphomicrobiaceae bacterium]